jgi:hypothetical protein
LLAIQGGLGMSDVVGHVDFFPNNGKNQPGCSGKLTAMLIKDLLAGLLNISFYENGKPVLNIF